MTRRIIPTLAAVGTTASFICLYITGLRWRFLHLAARRRIVELERLLRFEREQVDELTDNLATERKRADGYVNLAREALRMSTDRIDALTEELRQRRELASLAATERTADPNSWATLRHMARMERDNIAQLVRLAEGRGEPTAGGKVYLGSVTRLSSVLIEAADRGQHAAETVDSLVAAVDAMLAWESDRAEGHPSLSVLIEHLRNARASIDDDENPPSSKTKRDMPADEEDVDNG